MFHRIYWCLQYFKNHPEKSKTTANEYRAQNTPEAKAASKASIKQAIAAGLGLSEDNTQYSDTDLKQLETIMENLDLELNVGQVSMLNANNNDMETHHDISTLIPNTEEPPNSLEATGTDIHEITNEVISQLVAPELLQLPPLPPFMTTDQILHSTDMEICKPCSDDDTVETENTSLESQGYI